MAESNRAGERAGSLAHGVSVVAALYDPFRAGASGDDADVMAPHHDDPNAGPAGIAPDASPVPREPEIAARHPEMLPKPPAAPSRGSPAGASRHMNAHGMPMAAQPARHMVRGAIRVRGAVSFMVKVPVGTRICVGLRKGDQTSRREQGSEKFLLHHHS